MILTKEECLKARYIINDNVNCDEMSTDEFNDSMVVFNNLINEHFDNLLLELEKQSKRIQELELKEKQWIITERYYRDELKELKRNPPLKFEELHEGMWVWDNNDNKYNKIIEINNDVINFYYVTNSPTRFTCKFEENRFYRYETVEKPEFLKKSMVVKR